MFTVGGSGGVVAWFPSWKSENQWNWLGTAVAVATLIGSFLFKKRQKNQKRVLMANQELYSIEIADGVYKSGLLKDEKSNVLESFYPEVSTLYHAFLRGMETSENGPCLGERVPKDGPYKFIDYAEVFKKSRDLGSAFITKLGITPDNDTHVGIYARNCSEWFITTMACIRYSMVVVPLYDTLGADAASFIIEHTAAGVVIAENKDKAKKLLEFVDKTPSLKHIVLIDSSDSSEVKSLAEQHGVQVHDFQELLASGEATVQPDVEPNPDDTYLICYTSGTTGTPKGVMLSHRNVVANISAFIFMLDKYMPETVNRKQTIISYLPLSHVFEQTCDWCIILLGGKLGYYSGDIADLSDDMKMLSPTIFPVVPRLLNRFNDTLKSQVDRKSSMIGKLLFNFAYRQKLSMLKDGIVTNTSIWDKLIFRKAQEQLGGQVNLIVTGSAPISAEVLESCRVAFGAHIIEGYGQTESTALATCTWPGESVGGHCGGPAVCSLLKLDDVPDLNYFAKDNKGEIMIKGPSVTKGYYKDAQKTAELFDKDGFLHTGDVGHIQPNGALKIIDRKKHIFKLAQGEYVAPEKIENVYMQSALVQQIYVDGDSLERFLIAIVVPEQKALIRLYKEIHSNNDADKAFDEICKDKQTIEYILQDLQKLGKSGKLNSIEQVKKIHIEIDPFSVENGLLTPTLKSKRPQLRQKYQNAIQSLYKNE